MKKQHYVAAIACLIAGAIGFVSVYATEKAQERKQLAQQEQEQRQQETQVPEPSNNDDLSPVSRELAPKPSNEVKTPIAQKDPEVSVEEGKKDLTEPEQTEPVDQEKPVSKPTEQTVPVSVAETLHFRPENGIVWPLEGEVILDYSMDSTIFFPTLEQYRCNPAMVIAGAVNDKVFSVMRGKIIEVFNSEETGCTVRQDLGDGYIATYGQLKELNFGVGDIVESGQVIGYVSEPTKYYSVEGSNVYFSLKKDGNPVNPRDYLPIEEIDVPEQ